MSEKNKYYDQAIETFTRFKQDSWVRWINGVLYNNPVDPVITFPRAENINILFWVFNTLVERKTGIHQQTLENYCLAISKTLQLTHPYESNYDAIYTLLYFLNDTKPVVCRRDLELFIRKNSLENHQFGGVNLHYLLIKVYIPIEDSRDIPLADYLNNKFLHEEVGPYFYYIFLTYHFNYSPAGLAFEAFRKKIRTSKNITTETIQEMLMAYKEFTINLKSFGTINAVMLTVLREYHNEIPEPVRKLVIGFVGVREYLDSKYNLNTFSGYLEAERLMLEIQKRIATIASLMNPETMRKVMSSNIEITVGTASLASNLYGDDQAMLTRFGFAGDNDAEDNEGNQYKLY